MKLEMILVKRGNVFLSPSDYKTTVNCRAKRLKGDIQKSSLVRVENLMGSINWQLKLWRNSEMLLLECRC